MELKMLQMNRGLLQQGKLGGIGQKLVVLTTTKGNNVSKIVVIHN